MKRSLVFGLWLGAGLIANLAVAWSCANWVDPTELDEPDIGLSRTVVPTAGFIRTSLEPWRDFIPRVLPYRPIWLGFIADTLAFSVALGLLVWVPSRLLRGIRGGRTAVGRPPVA